MLVGVLLLALPAAAQQVRQSQSPLASDGIDIPDMQQLQQDWGHATVAAEVAKVVAQIGDLPTASRKLWDARLSEVTFPIEIRGEAVEWFDVVAPLQEVDVSEAGLKGLMGAFPSVPLRRDRLAATCVDEAGMPVPSSPKFGGPEEVLPSRSTVLYIIDDLDECWTQGGVKLVVHDADADPLAAISARAYLAGDMRGWARRCEVKAALSEIVGDTSPGEVSDGWLVGGGTTVDSVFSADAGNTLAPTVDTGFLDCRVSGPCPVNADCTDTEICSCDDHGSVVTRDFDRDGCPEQRAAYRYDAEGRMKSSEHDWDNDGDFDQRCTYDPPCKPGSSDCRKKCADLVGN